MTHPNFNADQNLILGLCYFFYKIYEHSENLYMPGKTTENEFLEIRHASLGQSNNYLEVISFYTIEHRISDPETTYIFVACCH